MVEGIGAPPGKIVLRNVSGAAFEVPKSGRHFRLPDDEIFALDFGDDEWRVTLKLLTLNKAKRRGSNATSHMLSELDDDNNMPTLGPMQLDDDDDPRQSFQSDNSTAGVIQRRDTVGQGFGKRGGSMGQRLKRQDSIEVPDLSKIDLPANVRVFKFNFIKMFIFQLRL